MRLIRKAIIGSAILALAAGCGGSDGADGANGADGGDGLNGANGIDGTNGTNGDNGVDGVDGVDGEDIVASKGFKNLDLQITQVKNVGGAVAVTFTVADNGNPVTNLTMDPIRIHINQQYPAANAYSSDVWSEYNFYERATTAGAAARLVQSESEPGTYTYTFLETIQEATTNDGLDTSLVQQVAMRIRGFETYYAVNDIYQVTGLPTTDGGVATEVSSPVGEIVTNDACNSCHGPRLGDVGHGGGYVMVEYCSNCHTADNPTRVTNGTDMMTMIHQIHAAIDHTNGGVDPGEDWSEVTFPQDIQNCAKCHQGLDGDNWATLPTAAACNSCHTDVDFVTGANHVGGIKADSTCAGCHDEANIRQKHVTSNSTPNNPDVPSGAVNFSYQLNSVTVASNVATVNFAILKDGVPITDLHTTYPPTGFTGGPSFRLAYALPQDGIDAPADWNNLGQNQAQPLAVTLASVRASAVLQSDGTYNVVLSSAPFPAGATLRTVGMDGYFTQTSIAEARHTPSVVASVEGEERRAIINYSGCLDCHERLELHGGSRVLAAETAEDSVAICIMCHNPNLSSSGNTFNYADYLANPGNYNADTVATIAAYGTDPFAWPEASQNFKDLVHSIHGSAVREAPYQHVRVRSGNAYGYDWSEVTFPGDPSNCSKCHTGNSYALDEIPSGALMSVQVTGTPANRTEALDVRKTLPNADDQVLTPGVAACYGCHNDTVVTAHMNQMGGAAIGSDRTAVLASGPAQCAICHDSGSGADVQLLHPGLNP